ncbi:MAG TPA: hypothetical protein VN181_15935, partial [Thermoanaerobaculia bacterium]|nr:hypothetical protein [Thermoanaerobaculia bacterium]
IDSAVAMTVHRKTEQRRIDLNPSDVVVVQNISTSTEHTTAAPPPHFPAYAKLLTKEGCTCQVKPHPNECDKDEGKGQFRNEVEEALKYADREVPAAPNGDCGPTGP